MNARPLALVLASGPSPVGLKLVQRLSRWCDVVLLEGTSYFSGVPRKPLRDGWHAVTGIGRPGLRVITTDLGGGSPDDRQRIQRDCALPLLAQEPLDRAILLLDGDESLECAPTLGVLGDLGGPGRLGLVPVYGAIDRVAPGIHCCAQEQSDFLRDPSRHRARPYLFPGPLAARVRDFRGTRRSLHDMRFQVCRVNGDVPVGHHLTMLETADDLCLKLDGMRHLWLPRVKQPSHLEAMLSAGVHHAGWWIAGYREPEPWLGELARVASLRVAGPMKSMAHLRALRAWAEARLDPSLPGDLVAKLDAYVQARPPDRTDFLNDLDLGQLSRPMRWHGHLTRAVRPCLADASPAGESARVPDPKERNPERGAHASSPTGRASTTQSMHDRFDALGEYLRAAGADGPLYYLSNPGNWGDALIRQGTLAFLRAQRIPFEELPQDGNFTWELPSLRRGSLIFGGGGAWCKNWNRSSRLSGRRSLFRDLIVLPSTYEVTPEVNDAVFFARDRQESLGIVPTARFCHDMAFFLGPQERPSGTGVGYFFRTDGERLGSTPLPEGNLDLSMLGNHMSPVDGFFDAVGRYAEIHTDRLHVAVAACLLGRALRLYPGRYFKNRAVYLSSMDGRFPEVSFCERFAS